jgi:hypothetical protein
MKLIPIPSTHVMQAWNDGAHALSQACETSGGEIEGPQLKLILSRGERTLIRMECEAGIAVGWGVVRIDQLPNVRVLFITDLVAPGAHFERFFESIKAMAVAHGCTEIRCAAKPAQARLYRMKAGFLPVYEILKVEV